MNNKIFIFLLLTSFSNTFSQSKLDSLNYYYQSKDFDKGIIYAENLKKRISFDKNFDSQKYFSVQYFLIYMYEKKDNNENIIHSTELALNFLQVKGFEETLDYTKLKAYLVHFYYKTDNDEKIKKKADEIINFSKDNINYQDSWFANLLTIRGLLSYKLNEYHQAEELLNRARLIHKQKLEPTSIGFILGDECLVKIYTQLNHFKKAKPLINNLFLIYKANYSNDIDYYKWIDHYKAFNHNIAINHNKLGKGYLDKGQYKNAEEQYRQALTIFKEIYKEDSAEYLLSYNNLAILYHAQDKFIEAEEIYRNTLNKLDKDHSEYVGAIYNLSQFYLSVGQLAKADYYTQIGLDLAIKKYGKQHKEFLSFLSSKARIKNELGQYKIAIDLYDECIGLAKDLYGRDSETYGTLISNSVSPYLENGGTYDNAEKLLSIDYKITKYIYGDNHHKTAQCLLAFANIYSALEQDRKAIEYNLRALNIIEISIGKESTSYAASCSSLGVYYSNIGDLENAEKYLLMSYEIKQKLYGQNSMSRIINLKNIVEFRNKDKRFSNKNDYFLEYLELIKFNLIEMNTAFSQAELLSYNKKILPDNTYLTTLYFQPKQHPELYISSYENELLLKNLSLRNQQRIKTSIQKSDDIALQKNYEQFISNKRQLQKLQENPNAKEATARLLAETEVLEKELVRKSALFAEAKSALSVTFNQIKKKLQPNEVAIDLVAFNYYNKKWTDSIVYAAFVIKKDYAAPKFIPLFEQKQLELLLHSNKSQADRIGINDQYIRKEISDLFLKPLADELKGNTAVYLSPTGLGHQINFKALPVSPTQTFGERYQVHLLGSTAELISYKTTKLNTDKKLEFYLYGAIDYDKNTKSAESIANENDLMATAFNELSVRSGIEKFGYLGGTKVEVNQIKATAKQNGFAATTVFSEVNATEESIKKLDGKTKPYVLHLATHGFFFTDVKQRVSNNKIELTKSNVIARSDNPMMRSGLLLAGANKYWGKTSENIATEDGILTASEISNLDLSTCQLVVMSACETGLGEIKGSEGVFGLQRAFKMAGVKNIIMSLWKVPDAQTAELFDVFYKTCFSGKSIHDALQLAQSEMSKKYSPYYWAGFILLE